MQQLPILRTLPELKDTVHAAGNLALVLCGADWSGATAMMKPVFESFHRQLAPQLQCYWLDIDVHTELAQALHIETVPTALLFREGALLGRVTGMIPRFQLIRQIGSWLQLPADDPWLLRFLPEDSNA